MKHALHPEFVDILVKAQNGTPPTDADRKRLKQLEVDGKSMVPLKSRTKER